MFKSKLPGLVPEVILPDFDMDDDNTTTITKSRRVSFGTNFVKEFIVGSAVSAQCVNEYEQAFSSSDSSNANSSHSVVDSKILSQNTYTLDDNHPAQQPVAVSNNRVEPTVPDVAAKGQKFSSTICFSVDSPTADMEFTEGCLTLAKSILDKKNKEMTLIIQAKPKGGKQEGGQSREETKFFEGSQYDMSMTHCFKPRENKREEKRIDSRDKTRVFNDDDDEMSFTRCSNVFRPRQSNVYENDGGDDDDDDSDLSSNGSFKENKMPLNMIMNHLDKDNSGLDDSLFNPEKSLNDVLNINSVDMSLESEKLNINESMDISKDFQASHLLPGSHSMHRETREKTSDEFLKCLNNSTKQTKGRATVLDGSFENNKSDNQSLIKKHRISVGECQVSKHVIEIESEVQVKKPKLAEGVQVPVGILKMPGQVKIIEKQFEMHKIVSQEPMITTETSLLKVTEQVHSVESEEMLAMDITKMSEAGAETDSQEVGPDAKFDARGLSDELDVTQNMCNRPGFEEQSVPVDMSKQNDKMNETDMSPPFTSTPENEFPNSGEMSMEITRNIALEKNKLEVDGDAGNVQEMNREECMMEMTRNGANKGECEFEVSSKDLQHQQSLDNRKDVTYDLPNLQHQQSLDNRKDATYDLPNLQHQQSLDNRKDATYDLPNLQHQQSLDNRKDVTYDLPKHAEVDEGGEGTMSEENNRRDVTFEKSGLVFPPKEVNQERSIESPVEKPNDGTFHISKSEEVEPRKMDLDSEPDLDVTRGNGGEKVPERENVPENETANSTALAKEPEIESQIEGGLDKVQETTTPVEIATSEQSLVAEEHCPGEVAVCSVKSPVRTHDATITREASMEMTKPAPVMLQEVSKSDTIEMSQGDEKDQEMVIEPSKTVEDLPPCPDNEHEMSVDVPKTVNETEETGVPVVQDSHEPMDIATTETSTPGQVPEPCGHQEEILETGNAVVPETGDPAETDQMIDSGREPPLVDGKVLADLTSQSAEPGCVWTLGDVKYSSRGHLAEWTVHFKLLDSYSRVTIRLQVSNGTTDSLDSCSLVKSCRIHLPEDGRLRRDEYLPTLNFGFDQQRRYLAETSKSMKTTLHVPYFLDQINSFTVRLNSYLRQMYRILTEYPGSRLNGSKLSFRLFSFPIFFSSTVVVDLRDFYGLSKSSLSFDNDFGHLNESKIGDIFESCLGADNCLCEFVIRSTRYIVEMERKSGFVSKRNHIRLLPIELR